MRVAMFSVQRFERAPFEQAAAEAERRGEGRVEISFLEAGLGPETAALATGHEAVCAFVNDRLDAACLEKLHAVGVRLVALRSAGFNHVDVAAAERLGLAVARVPAYSPHAVAEHAVGLLMALNRRIHRAYNRTREHNFALDGLMGMDLCGKTVGVVGTGKIGAVFCRIMRGFGCVVVASDPVRNAECEGLGVEYAVLEEVLRRSDVMALHCPLTPTTRHLIDDRAMGLMKPGVLLVNTSRGAIIDTRALIAGLKGGRLGGVALDVYEEEADVFFRDLSEVVMQDDLLARLLTFPNVLVTAHQGFFTREAMGQIAGTTVGNCAAFGRHGGAAVKKENLVTSVRVARSG